MHKDTYTTANPYTDNGYSSRADYLAQLCDDYPADVVHTLADLLGETEDFDGLVTMLEDYSETEADDADAADDAAAVYRDALAARDAAAVRTARESLAADNAALRHVLRAFVEQANKLREFPQAYDPYIGVLVAARAALDAAY